MMTTVSSAAPEIKAANNNDDTAATTTTTTTAWRMAVDGIITHHHDGDDDDDDHHGPPSRKKKKQKKKQQQQQSRRRRTRPMTMMIPKRQQCIFVLGIIGFAWISLFMAHQYFATHDEIARPAAEPKVQQAILSMDGNDDNNNNNGTVVAVAEEEAIQAAEDQQLQEEEDISEPISNSNTKQVDADFIDTDGDDTDNSSSSSSSSSNNTTMTTTTTTTKTDLVTRSDAPSTTMGGTNDDSSSSSVMVLIVLNIPNVTLRALAPWLEDCRTSSSVVCRYHIFTDAAMEDDPMAAPIHAQHPVTFYPSYIQSGYQHFGARARFQMEWIQTHIPNYDYYLKLDEDGYLCLEAVLQSLRDYHHKENEPYLVWGRFHCLLQMIRMDENYLLLSQPVVSYLVHGWKAQILPYHERFTLGIMLAAMLVPLHNTCGWTYWAEHERIHWGVQWNEPEYDSSWNCSSYLWLHHLNETHVWDFRSRDTMDHGISNTGRPYINHTGCPYWPEDRHSPLPPWENLDNVTAYDATANLTIATTTTTTTDNNHFCTLPPLTKEQASKPSVLVEEEEDDPHNPKPNPIPYSEARLNTTSWEEHGPLLIIWNVPNLTKRPPAPWLEDCIMPRCRYQIFTDATTATTMQNNTSSSSSSAAAANDNDEIYGKHPIVFYPPTIPTGYQYFGARARYQMEWVIEHIPSFQYYLKLDDDGYLCLEAVFKSLHEYNGGALDYLVWGRFHCLYHMIRMDENFLLLSRKVIVYLLEGWKQGLLPYDEHITLGIMLAAMLVPFHNDCGWTYWGEDAQRIHWGVQFQEPQYDVTWNCSSYIWLHHLNVSEVNDFRQRDTIDHGLSNTGRPYINETGCIYWPPGRLPPWENLHNVTAYGATVNLTIAAENACNILPPS